jgi:hypothetical protein
MLDLLGFVYYNKIRDYIKGGEDNKDKEVGEEVRAEERGDNNNKR